MRKAGWLVLLTALALVLLAGRPALAEYRLALVIGNAEYQNVVKLRNTIADAEAMRQKLAADGFEVIFRENVDRRAMNRAIDDFVGKLSSDSVALLYYAGHGVQIGAANYLLPIDIRADTANDIANDGLDLSRVLERVTSTQARFALAIIDACRDNPFRAAGRGLGAERGLSPSTTADGVMVVYSAGANQTALDTLSNDDPSPNGVFTREWLRVMSTPGLSVQDVAIQVRQSVAALAKAAGHLQTPAVYDQSLGSFDFVPVAVASTVKPPGNATPPADVSASASAPLAQPPAPAPAPAPVQTAMASPPLRPALPTPAPSPAGPAPAQACDTLGQPPRRTMGRLTAFAEGVDTAALDARAALSACQQAMRDWPGEIRFVAYAARASNTLKDQAEAVRLYRIAADAGNGMAQNNLGTLYENGTGVPRDLREAFRLYKLAVDQGYPRAMSNLGEMYVNGRSGIHDEREAVRLFMVGVELGDDPARNNLGVMYAEGRGGLVRNTTEAARLWRLAADQGNPDAQRNLRRLTGH